MRVRVIGKFAVILLSMIANDAARAAPAPASEAGFDAVAAWAEFSELMRLSYSYFEREDINGPDILKHFERHALITRSRAQFVDVLQIVARNFADPHLVVGPFTPDDPSIIPTASDIRAVGKDGVFLVIDVRSESDAQAKRVEPGDRIVSVDGVSVRLAIERLLGRRFGDLSGAQVDHGLNTALAGVHDRPRTIEIETDGMTRRVVLEPASRLARRISELQPITIERADRIAVIRFNNSLGRNETIAAFRAALTANIKAEVLVLDFRNTPSGGNTTVARAIMSHFTREP